MVDATFQSVTLSLWAHCTVVHSTVVEENPNICNDGFDYCTHARLANSWLEIALEYETHSLNKQDGRYSDPKACNAHFFDTKINQN